MTNEVLNEIELDMLCEAFNAGVHKSAKALSELTSRSVELSIPHVKEILSSSLSTSLTFNDSDSLVCIRLPISEDINGHAELLMTANHANNLANLCIPKNLPEEMLDEIKSEMLCEIANILLHACFGTVANMLNFDMDLSPPSIHNVSAIDLNYKNAANDKALAIDARLTLQDADIEGFIVIYIDNDSVSRIKKFLYNFMIRTGTKAS